VTVVSVTFDGSRISEAESETDGGTWDDWGKSTSPTQESDFVYQNTYSMSNIISSSTGGVDFDATTAVNYSATKRAIRAAIMISNYGTIDTTVAEGASYQIGSSPSDYYNYYLFGLYNDYQKSGGWILLTIDPNIAAYWDAVVGSPDLTTIDYYGWYADMAGAAKSDNIVHDTLSYVDVGSGLTLTGGSSTDADGVFQDFVDKDEGTQNNSWGIVATKEGILFVLGVLTIGSASETDFTDANKQIIFPDGKFDVGFCGIDIDLSHSDSVITINSCQFIGRGREAIIQEFHTNNNVDAVNDEIDIVGHSYETGDYVDYSKKGGSDTIGLTDGDDHWVRNITVDSISLHTTRQGSFADTNQVTLSQSGGSETHRLTKLTDTRPDFEVSGTSGAVTIDGCSFLNHRNIIFTAAASVEGGSLEPKLLTQNSADISNVTITTFAIPGVACLQDPVFGTTTDLHDINFVQGTTGGLKGHALELDTAIAYTLTNINFSGYGVDASDQAAIYVSASNGTVTINVLGGTTPTYRTAGATVNIVVSPVTTQITVKDPNDVLVENARVIVEAGNDAGDLPFENIVTITRVATTASVSHETHGLANGEKVVIRRADQQEYNGIFVISNVTTNAYDYTVAGSPVTPATGTIISSGVVVAGLTSILGVISASRSYTIHQAIKGKIRKSSISPYYKSISFTDTVDKDSGLTKSVKFVLDE